MKKLIIYTIGFLFLSFKIYAQEKLTYYHMVTKTTPGLNVTQSLIEDFKKNNIDINFKLGINCAAKSYVDNEKNPILVEFYTGRYWLSLQTKDDQCNIDLSKLKYLGYNTLWYQVVVPMDSKIKTFDDIAKVKSIAYAGHTTLVLIEEINKKYKTNIKAIEFGNSNDTAKGILAGDAEVGIIADVTASKMLESNLMRIIAYGDPKKENSVFSYLPNLPKNLGLVSASYIFAVKNSDDDLYRKLAASMKQSKKEIDKKIPENRLIVVDSTNNADMSNLVYDYTFGLFELTKKYQK